MFSVGLIFTLNAFFANAAFTWKNCAPADAILQVSKVEVGPDPVVIPGDVVFSINGASTAPLTSSSLHISVQRKTFLLDIPVPCIGNIGSCTYNNLCTLVSQMISEDWLGVGHGIGQQIRTMLSSNGIDDTQCTQPARSLNIERASIHIPEIPSALSHFAAGDYHVHISIIDNETKKTNLCIDATFTLAEKTPCTGLLCIFG